MKTKESNCPVCGADALVEHSDHSFQFKHGRKNHTVLGLVHSLCDQCGVSLFLPEQLDANHDRVKEYQAKLVDYISPEQVLELREVYDITQAQANLIFGGGPTAFSKYERGIGNPSAGAARQMLTALRDPNYMVMIAASRNVPLKYKSSKAVKQRIIDILPADLRSQVEMYASSMKLSLQESCVVLMRNALAAESARNHTDRHSQVLSNSKYRDAMLINYAVDYEIQQFNTTPIPKAEVLFTVKCTGR